MRLAPFASRHLRARRRVQRGGFVQKLGVLDGWRRGKGGGGVADDLLPRGSDAEVQGFAQSRCGLVLLRQVTQVLEWLLDRLGGARTVRLK